jgi:parallel beta-helix repeat protein
MEKKMAARKMMSRKAVAAVCAGIMALGMAVPSMAEVIYVDINNTSGNEDGSLEQPYNTIAEAINVAVNADIIKVAPGVYLGDLDIVSKTIKLEGEDPITTIIQGTSRTIEVTGAFSEGSELVEITGFTITGGATAGLYLNSITLHAVIRNNVITGNLDGIYCFPNGMVTEIVNNTIILNNGSGIRIYATVNNTITGNIVFNNVGYGVVENNYGTAMVTYNNVIANTAGDYGGDLTKLNNISLNPQFVTGTSFLSSGSPSIDAGNPLVAFNDPDGTRNDQGTYGGPGAANYWPEPAGGPVVTFMSVTPPSVPVGGKISLQATGKIR